MAAPEFSPTPVLDTTRSYASPPVVHTGWWPDRPAELRGFQPSGDRLGYQGPDQGYAIKIANGFAPRLQLRPLEHTADAITGCLGVALRRASMFSRAPVVHDLTVAFTIWGFLDASAPDELVELRGRMFTGVAHGHHYAEARAIADLPPDDTLRMTPQQIAAAYPGEWRTLLGVSA